METRALAIAFFYAVGTGIGGIIGPLLFGNLIASGNRGEVAMAFFIGAGVMALRRHRRALLRRQGRAGAARGHRQAAYGRGGRARRPTVSARAATLPARAGARLSVLLAGIHRHGAPPSDRGDRAPHEVEAIGRAVDEGGPISRDELSRLVGARRWGPGRFRRALDEALAAGRIRRCGAGRYEAA